MECEVYNSGYADAIKLATRRDARPGLACSRDVGDEASCKQERKRRRGGRKKKEGGGLLTPTAKYNVRAIEEKYVPVNGKRSVESRCFTVSRTLAG